MTIKPILRPYTNQDGLQQVRIIISDRGKRNVISTKIFVPGKYWDAEKNRVKANAPNAGIINQAITMQLSEIQKDLYAAGNPDLLRLKKITLSYFIEQMLQKLSDRVKFETVRVYQSNAKKIKNFEPGAKVSDLSTSFLERLEKYCRNELGNSDGGINNTMQFAMQVCNEAVKKGLIRPESVSGYKQKSYHPAEKVYLTREEMDKWRQALSHPDLNDRHILVGHYFLFSCFTGLRHRDCMKLNKSLNVGGRLVLYTNKTGTPVSLKMNEDLQALFNKCLSLGPLLPNNKTNPYLAKVARLAGIKKHVTFHVSRHSFCTQCANLGIPIEVASKLMGHTDISTTAIYYKLANPVLDKAMEKWV